LGFSCATGAVCGCSGSSGWFIYVHVRANSRGGTPSGAGGRRLGELALDLVQHLAKYQQEQQNSWNGLENELAVSHLGVSRSWG